MLTNILDRKHDRRFAELVNELTQISKTYGRSQQLRERLSQAVGQLRKEIGNDQLAKEQEIREAVSNQPRVFTQLVVAHDHNGAIGLNNGLPWDQNTDMRYFRRSTIKTALIMGSNTFKSMEEKPLEGRFNIVVTSKFLDRTKKHHSNLAFVGSLEDAYKLAAVRARELCPDNPRISVVGGAMIYRQAMKADIVDVVRETIVSTVSENADAYFLPRSFMEGNDWQCLHEESRFKEGKDQFSQNFRVFVRNKTMDAESHKRLLLSETSYIG